MNNEYHNHIQEVTGNKVKYKKIDIDVLLDPQLTKVEINIYLAILKLVNYNGEFTRITNKEITRVSGIGQNKQYKYINKLIELGYIYSEIMDGAYGYIIGEQSDKYIRLPLNYFNMKADKKEFVKKLKYLSLSNGNNTLPTYNTCYKKSYLTREEYNLLKKYNDTYDVDIYESLKMTTSNEVKKESKVIASKVSNTSLEGMNIDAQLDALLN